MLILSACVSFVMVLCSCSGRSEDLNADRQSGINPNADAGFKAIRFDDAGVSSASVNSTVRLSQQDLGASILVEISIADEVPSRGVTLELSYDAQHYSPVGLRFAGLIDTPVQMSVMGKAGWVSLGQVDTQRSALRSGRFASVQFERRPFAGRRTIQAVHSELPDSKYSISDIDIDGMTISGGGGDSFEPISYTVRAIFVAGDGNDDGETNIADLTPIGLNFAKIVRSNDLYPARADYDHNGEVNIADLTELGAHFGERTTGLEVFVGDEETGGSLHRAYTWGEGAAPAGSPDIATADPADVWRYWTGEVTVEEHSLLDLNGDISLFVSARAVSGDNAGELCDAIKVGGGGGWPEVMVTGMRIEILSASGGSGPEGTDFFSGDTAIVPANSSLTLGVSGISGFYGAEPFDAADAGFGVPQYDYDLALMIVRDLTNWAVNTTGANGMRSTAPLLALSADSGNGVTATVFPDDDPESIAGSNPEGTLRASVGPFYYFGAYLPAEVTTELTLDVIADPAAPVVSGMTVVPDNGEDANGDLFISPLDECELSLVFDWGSGGAPASIDASALACDLFDFGAQGAGPAFTFVAGLPPGPGEFTVTGSGPYILQAKLSPGMILPGGSYGLRIQDLSAGGRFNSCNKPGYGLLVLAAP